MATAFYTRNSVNIHQDDPEMGSRPYENAPCNAHTEHIDDEVKAINDDHYALFDEIDRQTAKTDRQHKMDLMDHLENR